MEANVQFCKNTHKIIYLISSKVFFSEELFNIFESCSVKLEKKTFNKL